ncbi:MAG: hypothetical protein ACYCOO_09590 [Chitinophagaceae bacterium]
MKDLIQSLQDKVGLSEEKAKEVAEHLVEYVKSKVPSSMHSAIDSILGKSSGSKASELLDQAKEKFQGLSGDAAEFAKGLGEKVSGIFSKKDH